MRAAVPLLALVSLAFAPAPWPKVPRDDLAKMQGEWKRVSASVGGVPVFLNEKQNDTVIAGRNFRQASGATGAWTIALSGGKPGRIYFEAPGASKFHHLHGIYKLEGDTLTLCTVITPGRPRPDSFDDSRPGVWLEVFQRRKR